jgi:hypothetical protein
MACLCAPHPNGIPLRCEGPTHIHLSITPEIMLVPTLLLPPLPGNRYKKSSQQATGQVCSQCAVVVLTQQGPGANICVQTGTAAASAWSMHASTWLQQGNMVT